MTGPKFEWDPAKAAANLQRHAVSFEEARTVFQDPLAKIHADPDHSASERRDIIIGQSTQGRMLLVSFTDRGSKIRLISARLVTRRERRDYAMRKSSKAASAALDDLRPEYRFDYSKARPNPYADRLKGKAVTLVLDPEVAAAFPTSESVNTALRSVMGLVRRRSSRRTQSAASGRSNNQMQRTRSAKTRRRGPRR